MVTVIWEMRVAPEQADAGLAIVQRIWLDMRTLFHGYVGHRLLADADQRGHFVVVSEWASRAHADSVRDQYVDAEPVQRLRPLLTAARQRWVMSEVQ